MILMETIKPDGLYAPEDDALRPFGSEQTLAQNRSMKRGLPYCKIGKRVFYRGSDILAAIENSVVQTEA